MLTILNEELEIGNLESFIDTDGKVLNDFASKLVSKHFEVKV